MEALIGVAALFAILYFFLIRPIAAGMEVYESQREWKEIRKDRSFEETRARVKRTNEWSLTAQTMLKMGHYSILAVHVKGLPTAIKGCTKESLIETLSLLSMQ